MLRAIFAGSPDVSAKVLKDLVNEKSVEIVGVLTNPPSSKGRHKKLIPTPVASVAIEFGIPVLDPLKLNAPVREEIEKLTPDILICFAYGKIFGPKFMALYPLGGINLHPSLLPRWRGCAPVPAAILAGDSESGVTVQRLAKKMDSGDILIQKKLLLDRSETSQSFLNKVAGIGSNLFSLVLKQIESKNINPISQDETIATYCEMLKKEDGCIDWTKSAQEIDAKIRAYNPWPGAFTCANGMQLRIHLSHVYEGNECDFIDDGLERKPGLVLCACKKNGILIQCGSGIVVAEKLQWQSKKAMDWKTFLNGTREFGGTCCCSSSEG